MGLATSFRTELRYSASTSRSASEATAEPRSHVFDLLRSSFRYRTELRYSASTSRSASEATAEPRSHVFDLLRSSFRYSPPESYVALEATIQKRAQLSASARL